MTAVRLLLDALAIWPGESVLEVGCGSGVIMRELARCMWRDPQCLNQFPVQYDRLASDAGERPNGEADCRRRAALRRDTREPGSRSPRRLKSLLQLADREASTLAYADAFRAIMLAFVIATLLVPLLRNVAAATPSAGALH
jgi:hypothetical protein